MGLPQKAAWDWFGGVCWAHLDPQNPKLRKFQQPLPIGKCDKASLKYLEYVRIRGWSIFKNAQIMLLRSGPYFCFHFNILFLFFFFFLAEKK